MRNLLAVVFVLGLGYVAYTVSPNTVTPTKVQAGSTQNVTGWAWSENIGWISLNSYDCDTDKNGYVDSTPPCGGNNTTTVATDYGVNISPIATTGTGDFSGNAWSDNVGWISFNRADTGTPPAAPFNGASGPIAQVDWITGKVTGWARVLSQAAGGGDGWIKLSDEGNSFWIGNGVKIDSAGKFSGYAWSSDSVGWIDFAPLINGTTPLTAPAKVAVPCTASNPTFTASGTCDATASCVSGGSATQTNLSGVQSGTCSDGSTGVAYTTCTAPTTTCTAGTGTAGINSWFVGDGSCIAGTGENSTNSLADCKPKTKFWQF